MPRTRFFFAKSVSDNKEGLLHRRRPSWLSANVGNAYGLFIDKNNACIHWTVDANYANQLDIGGIGGAANKGDV